MTQTSLVEIRDLLASHAFLFGDPAAYIAGVDDALAEFVGRAQPSPSGPTDRTSDGPAAPATSRSKDLTG